MPKTNFCRDPSESQNALIIERIKGKMAATSLSAREMARRVGMKPTTYYDRLRHPETFRIGELRAIYKVLHIAEDDMARTKII